MKKCNVVINLLLKKITVTITAVTVTITVTAVTSYALFPNPAHFLLVITSKNNDVIMFFAKFLFFSAILVYLLNVIHIFLFFLTSFLNKALNLLEFSIKLEFVVRYIFTIHFIYITVY